MKKKDPMTGELPLQIKTTAKLNINSIEIYRLLDLSEVFIWVKG